MEEGKIYTSSPIEGEMIHLNNNLKDVFYFKRNIIDSKSAGSISGKENVIFASYPPASNLTIVYFFTYNLSRHQK